MLCKVHFICYNIILAWNVLSIFSPVLALLSFSLLLRLVEHCSANAEAMGSNPVEDPFFWAILQLLKLRFTAMVTYSFHFLFWSYFFLGGGGGGYLLKLGLTESNVQEWVFQAKQK